MRRFLASTALAVCLGTAGLAAGTAAAAAPATSASGTGTVTAALTAPRTIQGTKSVPMTCSSTTKSYKVSIGKVVENGSAVTASATIPGYHGPGTYQATVSMKITTSSGAVVAAGSVPYVPVTITSTGGTFSFSKTGNGTYPKLAGKTVSGSLSWTCPPAA
jgi:hypothetical protein